ncbi:MAG: hypothetical protein GC178_15300 [Flavobacteriales bacterium]|nr:hypothetical protein [Flavobacteriales bacterium]
MKPHISTFLMAAAIMVTSGQAIAQKDKKDDPKHTNYFQDVEEAIETKEFVVELSNGVSRMDFLKFKAKFTNNTNDFLMVDPSKLLITVDGKEMHPNEKSFILDPNDNKSKTIDLKDGANFHVDEFEVALDGFSVIPISDGKEVQMPDFQLPASTNSVESGNFEVNLKNLKQETKETWAKFEITYKGNDYGIVDPSRISVVTEGGDKFANDDRKSKNILLEKGDSKTVNAVFHIPAKVVDMQFAKLMVQWNDAMVETKAKPLDVDENATFMLDEALTAEKNK